MAAAPCKSHKDLIVWHRAMELAVEVHRLTARFPPHELFGLAAQLRRAAVSVPSNIAEGSARRTTRDLTAFLHVARGSVAEIETQLLLARQVAYIDDAALSSVVPRVDEVGRLLNGLIAALQRRLRPASDH
jgi:four helix bundle protein